MSYGDTQSHAFFSIAHTKLSMCSGAPFMCSFGNESILSHKKDKKHSTLLRSQSWILFRVDQSPNLCIDKLSKSTTLNKWKRCHWIHCIQTPYSIFAIFFCFLWIFLWILTYSSLNQSNIFYVPALCDIIRHSGGESESGIEAKELSRLGGKKIQH